MHVILAAMLAKLHNQGGRADDALVDLVLLGAKGGGAIPQP